MSRQNRHSTKTKAGRLRIEASAPGYDGAARSVHVAGPMHVTLRLYPRQDPLEPPYHLTIATYRSGSLGRSSSLLRP